MTTVCCIINQSILLSYIIFYEELFLKCISGASFLYRKQEACIAQLSSKLQDASIQLENHNDQENLIKELESKVCLLQDNAKRTKEQIALTLHLDDALTSARAEINILANERSVLREKEKAALRELKIVRQELQEAKDLISTVIEKLTGSSAGVSR